jgi:regulator of protease activity HflC (stomatin/prohibitin superfamily)
MVALPPLAATTSFPGLIRPAPVAQSSGGASEVVRATQEAQAAAAESTDRARAAQERVRAQTERAADQLAQEGESRPRPQLPDPLFSQSVGLFNNSFKVFVDIVLNNDSDRRVARVYGTPPAEPLNIPGPGPNRIPTRYLNINV